LRDLSIAEYTAITGLAVIDDLDKNKVKAVRRAVMKKIFEIANNSNADRIQLNVQNLTPRAFL